MAIRGAVHIFCVFLGLAGSASAQNLTIATVTRPPFSMPDGDGNSGFSLELWGLVAEDLGQPYTVVRVDVFGDMLNMVETSRVDAAVANISITSSREIVMDFSQPIFESGLQIMVHRGASTGGSMLGILFSRNVLTMLAASIAVLFGAGMLMWLFERKSQEYFRRSAKDAAFPAFWWALNLVVNGGFEERQPTTFAGRIFGVILVISSLFVVSLFVANVTATLTINAIRSNVNSINDLYGKQVGTLAGSTASIFMEARNMNYRGFSDLGDMLVAFENDELDAILFDSPILAFYVNTRGKEAELTGAVFNRENYGFAFPAGSKLTEPVNRSLLRIREDGTYQRLYRKWFGNNPNF